MKRLGPVLAVAIVAAVLGVAGGWLAGSTGGDRPAEVDEATTSAPMRPTYTRQQDPARIGLLLENVPCDPDQRRTMIVVGWGDRSAVLAGAAAQWWQEGAKYLETAKSCDTRWATTGTGTVPTYVVYLPIYDDAIEACRVRMTGAHKGDFATRLVAGNQFQVVCPCVLSNADMPTLGPDTQLGTRDRMFIGSLQRMLKDIGYLRKHQRGAFDLATERATRAFQADSGLSATGIVGAQTWAAIQPEACELYDF